MIPLTITPNLDTAPWTDIAQDTPTLGLIARVGRLPHLVRVDDEVLAQHGDADRRRHGAQVVHGSAEAGGLGEHRDGVGAGPLVGEGLCDSVQVGGDVALARRTALHLGDERERLGQAGKARLLGRRRQRRSQAPGPARVLGRQQRSGPARGLRAE